MQKTEKKVIYNRLLTDFSVKWDISGENPKEFTVLAGDVLEIEEPYATHVKKHLANAILNERGLKNGNAELTLREINEEIDIDI